jgi:flagellin-like protein
MKFSDDGVSPVIGVIVMVAITVILAAAIAFFIFGQVSTVSHEKVVTATAVQQGNNLILVTYLGGQDANACTKIKISITPEHGPAQFDQIAPGAGAVMPGSRLSFQGDFSGKDQVQITAGFRDGSEQLIYDNSL